MNVIGNSMRVSPRLMTTFVSGYALYHSPSGRLLVRRVTEPGRGYDAEFDFLWRGQAIPHIVADYSDTMLGTLIQGVVTPRDMDERFRSLQCRRPDGRAVYEEV